MPGEGLLLNSMKHFFPIIREIIGLYRLPSVVEIGADKGETTMLLIYEKKKGNIGELIVIEPFPSERISAWSEGKEIDLRPTRSLEVLPRLPLKDVYIIDGDHNYYTVYHELKVIFGKNKTERKDIVIFCHDVCWPWDRRDMYYDPESIPVEHRHRYTTEMGVVLHDEGVVPGGFGGFPIAVRRGGPKNGVLTAIEDAISECDDYRFFKVEGIFGLGVIVPSWHRDFSKIEAVIAPFADNYLIRKLERNRVEIYLELLRVCHHVVKS
ncbi:MAG: class I SAM-dependent methyltransferase [Deltaproteobacteria bacterium]|nr:MAG: class I SAM-dependent methyltransferase [Deltaproteobacteria bacterium]